MDIDAEAREIASGVLDLVADVSDDDERTMIDLIREIVNILLREMS